MELEEEKIFVPAKKDIIQLSHLVDCEKVSVLSYNVLSQLGARRLQRPDVAYRFDTAYLSITRRRELLLKEMWDIDADIMCLQEVDDYDDFWAAKLTSNGYDSIYFQRPSAYMDDGLVIAFRKSIFQLFDSRFIQLNDIRRDVNDVNIRSKVQQDNIAIFVKLQPWETSKLPTALVLANVQFASGTTADMEQVRELQTLYICRSIAQFNSDTHLPVVLAGSINSSPSSDVYHLVQNGCRKPRPMPPKAPCKPIVSDPTPSSVYMEWELEETGELEDEILGYKIAIKNCKSSALGYMHEVEVESVESVERWIIVNTLSAGVTYQFRVAARNVQGYGHFSAPSDPITTLLSFREHGIAPTKQDISTLAIDQEPPPLVNPLPLSFGSGTTPRFEDGSVHEHIASQSSLAQGAQQATRNPEVSHTLQLDDAYANFNIGNDEPTFTYSNPSGEVATTDYVFHSVRAVEAFQVLELPTSSRYATASSSCIRPNKHAASNHVPIATVLAIKPCALASQWN